MEIHRSRILPTRSIVSPSSKLKSSSESPNKFNPPSNSSSSPPATDVSSQEETASIQPPSSFCILLSFPKWLNLRSKEKLRVMHWECARKFANQNLGSISFHEVKASMSTFKLLRSHAAWMHCQREYHVSQCFNVRMN